MNFRDTKLTQTRVDVPSIFDISITPQNIMKFVIYAGVGSLGGAISVALVIGLSILFLLLIAREATFSPGLISLTLTAVLIGWAVSWLLSQLTNRLLPGLFDKKNKQALQVVFIFSTLSSLLEALLFGQGL